MNKYQSINEVPAAWRAIKGIRLQLFQVNAIVAEAEASDEAFPTAHAKARTAFEEAHQVVKGQWVPKGGKA